MTRPRLNEARTKNVATVRPSCDSVEMLGELIAEGVDRVPDQQRAWHDRTTCPETGEPLRSLEPTGFPAGVLLDLTGPKISLGQ